jgi:predicted nucleic acid-binding protein
VNCLIDTNIISEVRKLERCDRHVATWFASIDDANIYLSVLVLGEIRRGNGKGRRSDPAQARALDKWLSTIKDSSGEYTLPVGIQDLPLMPRIAGDNGRATKGPLLIKVRCCRVATGNCQRLAYPDARFRGTGRRSGRGVPRDLGSRCLVWNS